MHSFRTIKEIVRKSEIGSSLVVEGWVRYWREMKGVYFAHISDGLSSDTLQVVINKDLVSRGLNVGSAISITGELVKSPAKGQNVELLCKELKIVGHCSISEYPLQPRMRASADFLRQLQHLRSKSISFPALLRLRQAVTNFADQFFQSHNFLNVHTPIITSTDCEGAGDVFNLFPSDKVIGQMRSGTDQSDIDENQDTCAEENGAISDSLNTDKNFLFFRKPVHLTVSAQLHLEALTGGIRRVYTISPCFRAESTRTRQHLAEFWMLEAEMAFVYSKVELMRIVQDFCRGCMQHLLQRNSQDLNSCLQFFNPERLHTLKNFVDREFHQVTYFEAVELLKRSGEVFKYKPDQGADLMKQHEQYLVRYFKNTPVFVTDYPISLKPFYMKTSGPSEDTAECFDLLAPGPGEICGGSLREHRFDLLKDRLERQNLKESLDWYLELRKYGHAPTGGFGIGLERYLQYVLGIENIKDTIPFPRSYMRCAL